MSSAENASENESQDENLPLSAAELRDAWALLARPERCGGFRLGVCQRPWT